MLSSTKKPRYRPKTSLVVGSHATTCPRQSSKQTHEPRVNQTDQTVTSVSLWRRFRCGRRPGGGGGGGGRRRKTLKEKLAASLGKGSREVEQLKPLTGWEDWTQGKTISTSTRLRQ